MGFIFKFLLIMYGRLELISKLDNIRVGRSIGITLFINIFKVFIVSFVM
ncbi:MAG: hypothetical protein ACI4WW_05225 [Candidatus Coprovivens sp.]